MAMLSIAPNAQAKPKKTDKETDLMEQSNKKVKIWEADASIGEHRNQDETEVKEA